MNRSLIAKVLAFIVSICGAMVMLGWFLDIEVLRSILPQWVTMKFLTALSFFLSGISLYFITRTLEIRSELAQIVLVFTTFLIFFIMTILLVSFFLDIQTGIENLFVREQEDAAYTTKPGMPSIGTIISFLLVAFAGFLNLFDLKKIGQKIHFISIIILIMSGIAIIGYIISEPLLYYSIEGYSTAMALHTAILFTMIGTGFFIAGKKIQKLRNKLDNIFLTGVLIIIVALFILFLSKKNEPVRNLVNTSLDLTNHPVYSKYNFNKNDSVINIGIQPLYLPTGIILEVVRRDNILNNALSELGKRIEYHSFSKGADVNFFLQRNLLDGGVGGDMPALSISSNMDVFIPVILQKGNTSILSTKMMLSNDLKGKRIAYPSGSISHYFVLDLMQSAGIKPNRVKLIPMSVSAMAKALHNKDIDLFSAWEPNVTSALVKYPEFVIAYQRITTGYLYFSEVFAEANPEIINQILAAVIRSISWMKTERENLLIASEWNIVEMEKLTGELSNLSTDDIANLALKDILRYYSLNSLVIDADDLLINGSINNEYKFLADFSSEININKWDQVVGSFDYDLISEIIKNPKEFRFNDYDYDYELKVK